MARIRAYLLAAAIIILPSTLSAQRARPDAARTEGSKPPTVAAQFAGIGVRGIGPALTSGRVIAFAVNPADPTQYYVAVASGGVWKTANSGTTWTPVFDSAVSYSIGAITLDPKNPNVVWVGTGELNAQRSVGYGDGVYRSDDGGKSWRNVGLKTSEHIGRIVVDPRDSNMVYVAAQGPLWNSGGERGLYKTTDGGKTWKQSLKISGDTGVTDVVLDPRNPDRLYAAAWQRRRHVFTYLGGGPESGIYRSTDAGATWTKTQAGLPGGDLGRIGLAISPANPDMLYATVEAKEGEGGIYRSTDYAASWEKQGAFLAQGMYYGQIVCDPHDPERLYIPNVELMTSDDGGHTVRPVGERNKHVDNHTVWIEPANTRHLLVGCDGGVYESFDRGATWLFKSNLSVAQFYRVATDNALPFYHVYGGTQDNGSLGGPVRTRSSGGIASDDWYVTLGGDGFQQQADPTDPAIVYSESQDGGAARVNVQTGEVVSIQPIAGKGEPPLRWYWDSPLLISPHSHTRLYFAGNKLFRSEDRGDSWKAISPDLTRQIDRNKLTIMGKVWPVDAIAKGQSTSFYGNIVALAESPKKAGLIYAGTDDGLIQVTEDGGLNWRKIETFPGVPPQTYVSYMIASQHDTNTAYAVFENHKYGDYAPYVLKSTDAGRTWISVAGDLPKQPVLTIAEDHIVPGLLFVGTEFGAYFTLNSGVNWTKIGGLPPIPVRDIAIQRRENDLVLATFGRGFYVIDDYSPLRSAATAGLAQGTKEAALMPVRPALAFIERSRLGRGAGSQGETYFLAPNPPAGATISYYLKESLKTLKQKREEAESEAEKKKLVPDYPTAEQLRAEAEEDPPTLLLTITDSDRKAVRRLTAPPTAGLHRVTWDLSGPSFFAVITPEGTAGGRRGGGGGGGFRVMPGVYSVSLAKRVNGVVTELAGPVPINVTVEGEEKLTAAQRRTVTEMRHKISRLQSAVQGATDTLDTLLTRIAIAKRAIQDAPRASPKLRQTAFALEKRLLDLDLTLRGDRATAARNEPTSPSIVSRVSGVTFSMFGASLLPTPNQLASYKVADDEFSGVLSQLRAVVTTDFPRLERQMDAAGVPYTPGRLPDWKDN